MISTEQKTEYWLIGTLIKFVAMGRFPKNVNITGENSFYADNIDWWKLDAQRMEWVDEKVLAMTAGSLLRYVPEPFKTQIWLEIVTFFNDRTRHSYLCIVFSELLTKNESYK